MSPMRRPQTEHDTHPHDHRETRGGLDALYPRLHAIAARQMRGERDDHSLQATALLHEAYLRVAGVEAGHWQSPEHLERGLARQMRNVLVDHARARRTRKRDARMQESVDWVQIEGEGESDPTLAIVLREALERLAELNERQARVVELRFFRGLSIDKAALLLGVSRDTVKADWRLARAWLNHELERSPAA